MVCNESMEPVLEKVLLDSNDHLSYPFVWKENGRIYVFPENAFSGSLFCYEFDPSRKTFINKKEILQQAVLDSTILKYDNKYWLFATFLGATFNSDLQIFYADNLMGPYTAHAGNPVKGRTMGRDSAGNFIEVDRAIYRPAQNCSNYYGESITINKIKN